MVRPREHKRVVWKRPRYDVLPMAVSDSGDDLQVLKKRLNALSLKVERAQAELLQIASSRAANEALAPNLKAEFEERLQFAHASLASAVQELDAAFAQVL